MGDKNLEGMIGSLGRMVNDGLDAVEQHQTAPAPTTAQASGTTDPSEDHAARFVSLFETTFLVAAADGHVADEELTHMASSMAELADGRLQRPFIDDLLRTYGELLHRDGFEKRLASIASVLRDADGRRLAFVLAAGTAYADGKVVEQEVGMFHAIAGAFAIPADEASHLLAQVHKQLESQLKV